MSQFSQVMQIITSTQNPRVKAWEKLKKTRERQTSQQYIIEGEHLVFEAFQYASHLVDVVIVTETYRAKMPAEISGFINNNLVVISEQVAKKLSSTQSWQGIFAIMYQQKNEFTKFNGKWLVLDNIQDPGNVGTMIRTADAAGLNGIITLGQTADIYNPKVLRAMQGSHFHLPVVEKTCADLLKHISHSMPLMTTALEPRATNYHNLAQQKTGFLVMGNEGQGVQQTLIANATELFYIPMYGQAESLNVAVATGLCCFAWVERNNK